MNDVQDDLMRIFFFCRTIFAFVARRSTSSSDNQCHVFCELEPNQPAAAITAFANKVIPSYGAQPYLRDI